MHIRYSTWSMAAVLLVAGAGVGHAAVAKSSAADPNAAAPAATAAKKPAPAASAVKKPAATPVHSTKRRATAHPAVLTHGQTAPAPSRITEIQEALAKDGTYQGMPSGRWDSATVDAMRQFQNQHDLNPSGKIDALTLQRLGLGSQVAGMGAPLPLAGPQASAADNNERTARP